MATTGAGVEVVVVEPVVLEDEPVLPGVDVLDANEPVAGPVVVVEVGLVVVVVVVVVEVVDVLAVVVLLGVAPLALLVGGRDATCWAAAATV